MDYRVLADVLRVFSKTPFGKLLPFHEVARASGRGGRDVELVYQELNDRKLVFLSGNKMHFGLLAPADKLLGRNPAQLLALDLAAYWMKHGKKVDRIDDLPAQFRTDENLLFTALDELKAASAIIVHASRGRPDSIRIEHSISVYEYGPGVPLRSTNINVAGDYVARDKNTAQDGGMVVASGGTAFITTTQELRQVITALADELEDTGEQGAAAAGALRHALEQDNRFEVAKAVDSAATAKPELKQKLLAVAERVTGGLLTSALFHGIKAALL